MHNRGSRVELVDRRTILAGMLATCSATSLSTSKLGMGRATTLSSFSESGESRPGRLAASGCAAGWLAHQKAPPTPASPSSPATSSPRRLGVVSSA